MSSVSTRAQYFLPQFAKNKLIRDLSEGLYGLRGFHAGAGEVNAESPYLPRLPKEPDPFYKLRLNRSYLTNYFERAIKADSGKVLWNDISVKDDNGEDRSKEVAKDLDDIDLEGMQLKVWAQSELQKAMRKGATLAFADYNKAQGRSFVRQIDIDEVLEFEFAENGKLIYLKFEFDIDRNSEHHGTEIVKGIYELWPTAYRITDSANLEDPVDEGEVLRYRNGSTRINDEIPVSVMYLNKKKAFIAESPYQTLAELTLEHFQEYSQYKNMMFYATTPILFGTNMPEDFIIDALSSYMFLKFPETGDKAPDMKWVQVNDAPLEQCRKMIEDIEKRISQFGLDQNELRIERSATESAIDSRGTNAALIGFSEALAQHIERVIELMDSYTLETDVKYHVSITPDAALNGDAQELQLIQNARINGDLPWEAFIDLLIDRKILPPNFDKDKNWGKIQKEVKAKLDQMIKETQNTEDNTVDNTPTNNENE